MKLKHIYIIRHGETEFNRKGIIQGSGIDSDLNETGHKQALAFFNRYKHLAFDKIYISTLKRTWQTVELFAQTGIPVEKHSGLNEISWGKYEGTNVKDPTQTHFDELIKRWRSSETDFSLGGGESPDEVAQRQKPVWDLILSRPEEKNVLVCMHGRAMRIFLCLIFNLPLSQMDKFRHSNTSLYHITYEYDTHNLTVERENCVKHLE